MIIHKNIWHDIANFARYAPSPHNTQPYRLRVTSEHEAELVFVPQRGLYVGDPKGRFTWLTAGIFVEICDIAAHSMSYQLHVDWDFTPMYQNGDYKTLQTVARLRLELSPQVIKDIDASLILKRHTSRLPYNGQPIPENVIELLQSQATAFGHSFNTSSKAQDIAWVKTLNKNSLFNDLDDSGIREELKKWLRYSRDEAHSKKDGLSAECLHMPGWLLRSFFYHHRLWTLPGLQQIVDKIYMSTMKGIGTIAWLQGPYVDESDWVKSGSLMIRLWLILTEHGIYWHPYGSVITNDKSRQEMLHYLGLPNEASGNNMVWLLLRMGYSADPPISERLPMEHVLL